MNKTMMKKTIWSSCVFGLLSLVAAAPTVAVAEETATLRLKLVYDGKAPAPKPIDGSRDAFCAPLKIFEDKLIVGADGGIKNIVLMYDEKKSDAKPIAAVKEAPEAIHKLDNKDCMFEPKVLVTRPGQTIEVFNSDQTGHNANFNFFNQPQNVLIPVGGSKKIELKKGVEEPSAMPVECNVHPWMKAHVIVLDHPYVGVSDAEGVIEIKDLPVGQVTFRVWHEAAAGAIDDVTVDGKKQKWSRGRMEITLKAGVNDLGVVKIPAAKFKP
jgi:plastocyanin